MLSNSKIDHLSHQLKSDHA